MSKWQYGLALVGIYACGVIFCLTIVGIVASVTVIPMMENHKDHGSIFNDETPPPPPICPQETGK